MKKFSYFMILWAVLIGYTANAQTCSATANIPANGTTTVSGVQITSSSSGSVNNTPISIGTCDGSNISSGSLVVGDPSPWSITLTFNKPVNDLVIVLWAAGGSGTTENFIFNSNGGVVSISSNNSCNSTINGNIIIGGGSGDFGEGTFKISAPNAFTTLTINGAGGSGGSLLGLCSSSFSTLSVNDVNGKAKSNTVDISPNPVKSMMTITSKENLKGYKVFDGLGELVMSSSSLKGSKHEVDISSIKTGSYIITVETENQKVNKKFIKE